MSVAASIIQIAEHRRIWRVTLDGAFYGDYRSQRQATEGAEAAAEFLRVGGRHVKIVTAQDEKPSV